MKLKLYEPLFRHLISSVGYGSVECTQPWLKTTKKTSQPRINDPLWRESIGDRWIPLTKGQCGNVYIAWRHRDAVSIQWRHDERDRFSNHRRPDGLLNRLFRRRSKKISKLRVNSWSLAFAWWRHQMELFSAFLAICVGNSPVPGEFPHKGQWRGALMFTMICTWINGWVNNGEAGDLRRYRAHYDVTVMVRGIHLSKGKRAKGQWRKMFIFPFDDVIQGAGSIKRCHLTSIGNLIVEIRRSYDRLISTMRFPTLVRWHVYIESGPCIFSVPGWIHVRCRHRPQ